MDHLTLTAGSYSFVFADDFLSVISSNGHVHYDLRAVDVCSVTWGNLEARVYFDGRSVVFDGDCTKDESYEVARNIVDRWKHARRVLLSPQK